MQAQQEIKKLEEEDSQIWELLYYKNLIQDRSQLGNCTSSR